MKKILLIMAVLMCIINGTSAQSGKHITASKNNVTRTIQVGKFNKLILNGSSNVVYQQTTGKQNIVLSVPDNLTDIVKVYVKEQTLILEMKRGYSVTLKDGAKIELRVSAPMVKSAVLNGSGDIQFKNNVNVGHNIDWTINGSGDIDAGSVKCNTLSLNVNGSGDLDVNKVSAKQLTVTVNGSGDIDVKKASASDIHATVNGSGDVNMEGIVADQTTGIVNGSGDVSLSGKSESATYSLRGSGNISAASLHAKAVTASTGRGSSGDISCYASQKITINKQGRSSDIAYKGNPKVVNKQ